MKLSVNYSCASGFTLVIAPLVSLVEDQLMYLKSINVPAVTLNASSSKVKTFQEFITSSLRIITEKLNLLNVYLSL